MVENLSQYNVFFFNFIERNRRDIELLSRTFKGRACRVCLYDQPDYSEFHKAVEYITTKNFKLFNYVVIVVLANKNPGSDVLCTRDGQIVFISRDLIGRIEYNPMLRYDKKKLLVLLQTNENLLLGDQYVQLKRAYPIQPLNSTSNLGSSFSAAFLEYNKVKQKGITIRIAATQFNKQLNDDWSEEDPPVSAFIQAFCDSFGESREKRDINEVFCKMCDALPDSSQPTKEAPNSVQDLVFDEVAIDDKLAQLYLN